MATRLATAARNSASSAIAGLLDAGSGPGTIQVRTGSQPATPNTAASGTLLLTFTLADPAFGAASNGTVTAAAIAAATGAADGTAGWFRALDSTGAAVLDGSVTATGGGGDMTLNTVTVSVGLTVTISGWTISMPSG